MVAPKVFPTRNSMIPAMNWAVRPIKIANRKPLDWNQRSLEGLNEEAYHTLLASISGLGICKRIRFEHTQPHIHRALEQKL